MRPEKLDAWTTIPISNRQASRSGPDTEPNTAHRANERIGLFAVDLSSQTSYVNINQIRRRIEIQTPDVLQQQVSRDNLASVAGKVLEEPEFAGP